MTDQLRFVDHSALRTNQAIIIALLSASFITETPWLIPLVSFLMLLGTVLKRPDFKPIYIILKAIRALKPYSTTQSRIALLRVLEGSYSWVQQQHG